MGLTGLEPVTLRLSSACSNQLSYRPFGFPLPIILRQPLLPIPLTYWIQRHVAVGGGKEIRTPDLLLAKQPLYQLSYAPFG